MKIDLPKFHRFINKWIQYFGFFSFLFFILSSCKPVTNSSSVFSNIDSVTPLSGSTLGGTLVTISGKGFVASDVVMLGSKKCSIKKLNSSQIECLTMPNNEGIYDLTITPLNRPGISLEQAFTYYPPPTVSSILPNNGFVSGNTAVEITGSFFRTGAAVKIAGASCTGVIVISSTLIACTTPAHITGVVDVLITNSDGESGSGSSLYTYIAAPVITSLSPTSGTLNGGTTLSVTGTNFITGASVNIDSDPCTIITSSSTLITCTTPAHIAGNSTVTVTNPDTQKGLATYIYRLPPTVSSVNKAAGALAGGTVITITGTDFITSASVTVGGSSCIVTALSSTQIICTTTTHSAGLVNIVVTNLDTQSGTLLSGYTYQEAPTVTSIGTAVGPLVGGTSVTITGADFLNGATVKFGTSSCSSVVIGSPTSISCTTSAHIAGAVDVVVTNTDSQVGTGASLYTYRNAPTVTLLSKTYGASLGGTTVTITGTGFMTGIMAIFGGTLCTTTTYVSTTSITCITPSGSIGIADVSVLNTDGQTGSLLASFTYKAAPTVTSASLAFGPASGGATIAFTGTGFESTSIGSLGGTACVNSLMLSSTSLQCKTPLHVAGLVDIKITNTDTQIGTLVNGYLYIDAPTVTSVTSATGNTGTVNGGTVITITGTKILSGATVYVGGTLCANIIINSATSITCTTPPHVAGIVNITVTNSDSQVGTGSQLFTYRNAPTITSVNKSAGALAGGTTVTITGTGFYTGSTVTFDGFTCAVSSVSSTSIICVTLSQVHAAGAVDVVVTNLDTQTGTLVGGYTYQAAPTVTSSYKTATVINSGTLAGGTAVTITGADFMAGATVKFGSSTCTSVVVVSSTSITCVTPAHVAGTVNVIVTNSDNQSGTGSSLFIYSAAPVITSLSVSAGALAGNTAMTITGTGFITGAVVTFGGVGFDCTTPIVAVNGLSITCTTPSHVAGIVSVVVTNTDSQTGTLLSSYTYKAAPTVTSSSVANGPAIGGKTILLTGTGFESTSIVSLGGTNCTTSLKISTTSIQCVTPLHVAGSVDIIVTNSDSQLGTLTNGHLYIDAPTVTSLDIIAGAEAGGTAVVITGTGFLNGATVKIGSISCANVVFNSSTSISCTTPANNAGAVTVTVTNTDSQLGSLASGFTYNSSLIWSLADLTPLTTYDYGSTSTNITQTFTLTNIGNITTSSIAISLVGSGWLIGTDTCNGTTVAAAGICTVQVTFLGALYSTASYTGILKATATAGGVSPSSLTAVKP